MEKPPVTVVIAEDEPLMRRVVRAALDEIGCDVVGEADDGSQVLRLINELNPNMILLDIRMPNQDGIESLKQIMEQRSSSYIIMLTSVDDDTAIADCLKIGAKDFLTKTMPLTEMMTRLSAHARNARDA